MPTYLTETFTGTAGTALEALPGWERHGSSTGAGAAVIDTGGARLRKALGIGVYSNTYSVPTPDYSVSADVVWLTDLGVGHYVGVCGRMNVEASGTILSGYDARISSADATVQLFKIVGGTPSSGSGYTQLGSSVASGVTAGNTLSLKLTMIGTTISVLVNGVTKISVTDTTFVIPGRAGLLLDGAAPTSTGMAVDNFVISSTSTENFIQPSDSNCQLSAAWDNDTASVAVTPCPGNQYTQGFTGTLCRLSVDMIGWLSASIADANCPELWWSIDGSAWTSVTLATTSGIVTLATGLAAGSHYVTVWWKGFYAVGDRYGTSTLQPKLSLRINGIFTDGASTGAALPTVRPKSLFVYGDSYAEGQRAISASDSNAGCDATAAFGMPLAEALNAKLSLFGRGGGGWVQTNSGNVPPMFTPSVDASSCWNKLSPRYSLLSGGLFRTQPDYLVTEYGVNDRAQSDASVTASVSGWFTAARAAAPDAEIFVGVPWSRMKASAILAGLSAYAGGYTTHVSDDGTIYRGVNDHSAYVLDLGTLFATGIGSDTGTATSKTTDGLHPNRATHALAGAKLAKLIEAAAALGEGEYFEDLAAALSPTFINVTESSPIIVTET